MFKELNYLMPFLMLKIIVLLPYKTYKIKTVMKLILISIIESQKKSLNLKVNYFPFYYF